MVGVISAIANRYKVTLTQSERTKLNDLTRCKKTPAGKFLYARVLLLCDAGEYGDPWKVADVASALGISTRTAEQIKQRFVEEGLKAALARKPQRKPRDVIFDGAFDTRFTALALLAPHPKATSDGLCASWPTNSSNSRSLIRSLR